MEKVWRGGYSRLSCSCVDHHSNVYRFCNWKATSSGQQVLKLVDLSDVLEGLVALFHNKSG